MNYHKNPGLNLYQSRHCAYYNIQRENLVFKNSLCTILLIKMLLKFKVSARKCLQISGWIYLFSQYVIMVLFTLTALIINFQVHFPKSWEKKILPSICEKLHIGVMQIIVILLKVWNFLLFWSNDMFAFVQLKKKNDSLVCKILGALWGYKSKNRWQPLWMPNPYYLFSSIIWYLIPDDAVRIIDFHIYRLRFFFF